VNRVPTLCDQVGHGGTGRERKELCKVTGCQRKFRRGPHVNNAAKLRTVSLDQRNNFYGNRVRPRGKHTSIRRSTFGDYHRHGVKHSRSESGRCNPYQIVSGREKWNPVVSLLVSLDFSFFRSGVVPNCHLCAGNPSALLIPDCAMMRPVV